MWGLPLTSVERLTAEVKSLVVMDPIQPKHSSGSQIRWAEKWMGETASADAAPGFVTAFVVPPSGSPPVGV